MSLAKAPGSPWLLRLGGLAPGLAVLAEAGQRLVMVATALVFCVTAAQGQTPTPKPAPKQLNGCQGEACDCYRAYAEARNAGRPTNFAIPLVRPLQLHARPDLRSPLLGNFDAPTKAVPRRQFILLVEPGLYKVVAVRSKVEGLRKGDQLHTLLNEGEGFTTATVSGSGRQVHFGYDEVELDEVRPTVTEDWNEVSVGRLRGYAQGNPFEGCLE
jgi:hypothetical protein